ncbi:MAG: hypothetical protein OXD40_04750 [bacterium]|nr:hypothetical protein [bacterium]
MSAFIHSCAVCGSTWPFRAGVLEDCPHCGEHHLVAVEQVSACEAAGDLDGVAGEDVNRAGGGHACRRR